MPDAAPHLDFYPAFLLACSPSVGSRHPFADSQPRTISNLIVDQTAAAATAPGAISSVMMIAIRFDRAWDGRKAPTSRTNPRTKV